MIPVRFKYSLPLLLMLISTCLYGQGRYGTQLARNSLHNLSSLQGKLYLGIDNYVQVDSSVLKDCNSILVHAKNAHLIADSLDTYLVIPRRIGKVRFNLYCIQGSDTLSMGYKFMNVEQVPEPRITLNKKPISTPATIDRAMLLNCDSLGIYFSDDIHGSENWMRITHFEVGYNYGGFHFSHTNESNQITAETFDILSKLGPDHEISLRATVESEGHIRKYLPIYRIRLY